MDKCYVVKCYGYRNCNVSQGITYLRMSKQSSVSVETERQPVSL